MNMHANIERTKRRSAQPGKASTVDRKAAERKRQGERAEARNGKRAACAATF